MSKDKQFYADDFYKDEHGTVRTGEYIEHNSWLRDKYTLTKIERPYDELQGVKVRCNYSQIFYPDSNMLLCNSITEVDEMLFDNVENGSFYEYYDADGEECEEEDADETRELDVFQYYLIDEGTAKRLMRSTDELIFYSDKLDLYILGVTHCGTSWDYVDAEFMY